MPTVSGRGQPLVSVEVSVLAEWHGEGKEHGLGRHSAGFVHMVLKTTPFDRQLMKVRACLHPHTTGGI